MKRTILAILLVAGSARADELGRIHAAAATGHCDQAQEAYRQFRAHGGVAAPSIEQAIAACYSPPPPPPPPPPETGPPPVFVTTGVYRAREVALDLAVVETKDATGIDRISASSPAFHGASGYLTMVNGLTPLSRGGLELGGILAVGNLGVVRLGAILPTAADPTPERQTGTLLADADDIMLYPRVWGVRVAIAPSLRRGPVSLHADAGVDVHSAMCDACERPNAPALHLAIAAGIEHGPAAGSLEAHLDELVDVHVASVALTAQFAIGPVQAYARIGEAFGNVATVSGTSHAAQLGVGARYGY